MIGSQLYLVVTGNYSWLNWITIIAIVATISDSAIYLVLPGLAPAVQVPAEAPTWFVAATYTFAIVVVVLSYWPVRNLLSSRQAMNRSFNAWHLVNTYGAFGSVTRTRYEVIVEGSAAAEPRDDEDWREYAFKAKPGDPKRMPRQIAPYHLRLDWLMWFIPISPAYAGEWFITFLYRLLEADRPTLRLLGRDPFDGGRPLWIRARLFHYRYSTMSELRATGAWWVRRPQIELVPPMRLR
jgi:membrane protein implicated in regulation of membrane protease activity